MATVDEFVFTREQLVKMLGGSIEMYLEFLNVHGKPEDQAQDAAVNEIMEGIDAEREMIATGDMEKASLRVIK